MKDFISFNWLKHSKQRIINFLVMFSVLIFLSFSLFFVSIPAESKVSFIPSYKVSLSFDLSISDAQMIFIKDQVSLNKNDFKFLAENHYFINSNYSTLKKLLFVNNDFSYLKMTIKKIYPESSYSIKNISVGDVEIDPEYVVIVPSKTNIFESDVIIDLSHYVEKMQYQQIDTSLFYLLFFYICNFVQIHFKLLFIVFSIFLTIITFCYRNNKFLLLFYLSVLFAAISYSTLWKTAVLSFEAFYDGNYLPTVYKIAKTQFLPLIILLSSLVIAFVFKYVVARVISLAVAFAITVFFACDVFSYSEFGCHITIADVFSFGKDVNGGATILIHFISHKFFLFISLLLLILVYLHVAKVICKLKSTSPCSVLLLIVVFFGLYYLTPSAQLSKNEEIYNSFLTSGAQRLRAEKQYSNNCKDYLEPIIEVDGLNKRKNVIVVFTESLSANESKFFGGLYDKTKNLDYLAANNVAFNNYYSNGFNTDQGNFAFFNSTILLHGVNSNLKEKMYSFSDKFTGSFLKFFKKAGYLTNCIYSADTIGEIDKIWEKVGLDNLYGGSDSFYKNEERLTFNSVPDKAMFRKTLALIPEWKKHGKFFTFIMTTTTHGPFIVPKTHEFNYHKTVEYFDEALGFLYRELLKQGYFEDGMLVVTGDHRVMIAYSNEELSRFGLKGIAKVPLVIVGSDLEKGIYKEQLSHDSLGPLLEYINLKKAYHYKFSYLPFASKEITEDNFILYQSHTPQDEVIVIDKDGEDHIVKLNGDDTYFEKNGVSENFKKHVLNTVMWLRK